jgi:hypothetical protein
VKKECRHRASRLHPSARRGLVSVDKPTDCPNAAAGQRHSSCLSLLRSDRAPGRFAAVTFALRSASNPLLKTFAVTCFDRCRLLNGPAQFRCRNFSLS